MKAHPMLDIEALFRDQIRIGSVAALAVSMVHEGHVYEQGYGALHGETEAVTEQTCFPLCSVSKILTAIAILRLVERNVLELDRPVLDYLDGCLLSQHGLTESVTMRRLLSHTAGFTRWHAPPVAPPATDLATYIRQVLPDHPRLALPGQLHDYSNFGINLAGYVAEVATGQPFGRLVHELLFEPLGMRQTTFERSQGPSFPAGSAVSTASDMVQVAQMLLDGRQIRGCQLLSPASLATMWTPHARLYLPDGAARGLAFRLDTYKGIRRVGHAGRGGVYCSRFRIAPDAGLAVMLFSQGSDLLALERTLTILEKHLFDLLLDGFVTQNPPGFLPQNPAQWSRYTGCYLGNEQGLAWISQEEGALILDWKAKQTVLQALQDDFYVGTAGEGPAVGFIPAAEDDPVSYLMINGRPLQRLAAPDDYRDDERAWHAYLGYYSHPSLSGAQVFMRDGQLCVAFDWLGGWLSCQPLGPSRFACRLGLIAFQETDGGGAAAFTFRGAATFKRCL